MDDDQLVPEELVGRLHRADESAVAEVVAGMSLAQRANLAMFCYRKSHLQRTGLTIAATCDRSSLVQAWGTSLGQSLFDRSRAPMVPERVRRYRPAITLAKSAAPDKAAETFDWFVDWNGQTEH